MLFILPNYRNQTAELIVVIIVVCEQFCICQVWGNCIVMLCRHLQLPWQSRFLLKFRTKSVDIIKSTTLRQAYEQQCRQH